MKGQDHFSFLKENKDLLFLDFIILLFLIILDNDF